MRSALLVLVLLAGCVSPSPQVVAASHRGREDADSDIANGRPRIAFIGLLRDEESALDPETGLTRFSVGCCKSHERIAFVEAYNAKIEEEYDAGRLAEMTLRHKATTREAVEERFGREASKEIRLGGATADGPGGWFRVEIAPSAAHGGNALWSTDLMAGDRNELRYVGGQSAKVLFDEFGTTLWLRDDAARGFATFDLPSARFLQVFPDPERAR